VKQIDTATLLYSSVDGLTSTAQICLHLGWKQSLLHVGATNADSVRTGTA